MAKQPPEFVSDKDEDVRVTLTAGKDYLDRSAALLSRVFMTDPILTWLLSSLPDEERAAYLPKYMYALLKAASLNGGVFVEANDWASTAVWMLPGKRVDNTFTMLQAGILSVIWKLGLSGIRKMLGAFQSNVTELKKQHMPGEQYHYLFFIGTDVTARGQGLATQLLKSRQQVAAEESLPIWLEATTKHSRDVYARAGFRLVGEMVFGKGTHAETGLPEKGGQGVPLYAMLWRPSWAKTDNENGSSD